MTTSNIESHFNELYGMIVSDSTISRVTDKILPIVKEWQERPLEDIYAVIYLDAIHILFILLNIDYQYWLSS